MKVERVKSFKALWYPISSGSALNVDASVRLCSGYMFGSQVFLVYSYPRLPNSLMEYSTINEAQIVSETDTFTAERYLQFAGVMKSTTNPLSILDIGCNTGRGGNELRKKFPDAYITGLDIVETRLKRIPQGIYDRLICESITHCSLPDGSFDFIVAGEVIEHIAPHDLETVLTEFKRILKEDGKLLMTTPNPDSFLVKLGRNGVFQDPSHLSIMSVEVQKRLLKKVGFNSVKILGSGKATKLCPSWFPIMGVFGSYLSISSKV